MSSSRRGAHSPSTATCNWDADAPAFSSPSMVRHGLNHSQPPVSVPNRASTPSETPMISFMAKSVGNSAL